MREKKNNIKIIFILLYILIFTKIKIKFFLFDIHKLIVNLKR